MTVLTRDIVAPMLPERPDNAHKGTMGALCSLTGSFGFAGAAILSARAALRSGVGLHYQILPKAIYPIFASSVYESVCVPVDGSPDGTLSPADIPAIDRALSRATAALIGCGMGNTGDTREVLTHIMTTADIPLIIDADGINALSVNIDILERANSEIILTPHVKEFSRLSGLSVERIAAEQEQVAAEFSERWPNVTMVLKSHRTVIANRGRAYINTAGNSGMAKGGSGDVLAGIIASLTAQGCEPFQAAAAGVYIHARSGDIAAERLGRTAMLPSDIIDCLSDAYRELG